MAPTAIYTQRPADCGAARRHELVFPSMRSRCEAELWDVRAAVFIRFSQAGISVLNTGHLHPKVKAARKGQLERFVHTCFQVTPYESYIALAEGLNAGRAGRHAQENDFSVHRRGGGRERDQDPRAPYAPFGIDCILGRLPRPHARVHQPHAAKSMPYKAGFGPMLPEIYHLPFPIPYHGVDRLRTPWRRSSNSSRRDLDPRARGRLIIEAGAG